MLLTKRARIFRNHSWLQQYLQLWLARNSRRCYFAILRDLFVRIGSLYVFLGVEGTYLNCQETGREISFASSLSSHLYSRFSNVSASRRPSSERKFYLSFWPRRQQRKSRSVTDRDPSRNLPRPRDLRWHAFVSTKLELEISCRFSFLTG